MMINVFESTPSNNLRPVLLRTAIGRLALGGALMTTPVASLFAESFEGGAVSIPSVMVQHDEIHTRPDIQSGTVPSDKILASPFADGFTTASCSDNCTHCGQGGGGCRCDGDPPGFLQKLCGIHDETGACWTGRADALLLWRNPPPGRMLVDSVESNEGGEVVSPILDADQLDSTAAAGPRLSLIRRDKCSGNAWETTYLQAGTFRSQQYLQPSGEFLYALTPPGIFGNKAAQPFDSGEVNLGGRLQSFEFNRLLADGPRLRWLAGFRWVEWQESFSLQDTNSSAGFDPPINDLYQSATINSLYGGQIGADLVMLTLPWLRVDSVVKAGAYYNNAVQRSSYTTNYVDDVFVPEGETVSVRVGESPASCGFIGEVGLTGVMPVTNCVDFRFGYFALWLSGIAQPTQQLSGQQLVPGEDPSGSLATNGGVLVQGLTLGIEGRW